MIIAAEEDATVSGQEVYRNPGTFGSYMVSTMKLAILTIRSAISSSPVAS